MRGLSFSWRRFLGLSALLARVSRRTGVPMSKGGLERKIGRAVLKPFRRAR